MADKLTRELSSFQSLWRGGFYVGDPLDPLSRSDYGTIGYISTLHATYVTCIRPHIKPETVALEIGPGRGAWTKGMLPAREVWALDALSAEHNGFFEYLGDPTNVRYFQVSDFECKMLPEDYFTYMFSYGCLCHVSFDGITQYATNIYPKLRSGSHCYWMVADYERYNDTIRRIPELNIWRRIVPAGRRYAPLRAALGFTGARIEKPLKPIAHEETDDPSPGRWYHAGVERTCSMLEGVGYQIIDQDVGTCLLDPVVHFVKP